MAGGSFRVNSRQRAKNAQAEAKRLRAEICPYCGSDRNQLRVMLKEPKGSDNWEIARKIILNCVACFMAIENGANERENNASIRRNSEGSGNREMS